MVTIFDISQEIFSINMLTALKSSLKHRRKHVLRPLQLYGDQALHEVYTEGGSSRCVVEGSPLTTFLPARSDV